MNAAALDLQEAVVTALRGHEALVSALGGQKIHALPPAALPFPYITFGRTEVYDWSADQSEGSEILFSLHVWSKHRGRREALQLIDLVAEALDEGRVVPTRHHLVTCTLDATEVRYDEDLDAFEGAVHVRALMEPA